MWAATRAAWERTVPSFEGLHTRADIRQSYAVLAGLTSADHGMVAAATMSLPERARSGRNYDYRYAWIRDQCYVGRACASLGHVGLLDSALDFVAERILADGPDLKPAYTVSGGSVPGERHVGLRGYPGGGDVVGNWVNQQFQLDSLGEALSMFAAADEVGALNQRHWLAVSTCVEVIGQKWQDPDAGIWELEDDVYTQSRLSCVAGLNAIARRTTAAQGAQWAQLADTILAQTAATSVHSGGYWQQSPTRAGVDASSLRPLGMGALSMDEPRSVATLHAVLHDLTIDGYVYRFRQDERPLADAEGSFTLCGFLMAQAQLRAGSVTQAVHFFERARASCTSSGLFTEEFDTSQHQLRGNLPQAFVHAAFIQTAVAVDGHLSAANDPKEEL
jgi:GH15 family glucan-1,4-alpha-glucosidase